MPGVNTRRHQSALPRSGRGRQEARCCNCKKLLAILTPSDNGGQVEVRCGRCKKNNVFWV